MRALIHALLAAAALFCGVAAAADAPFLWEVKGAKATHYLMGSVHLLPESAYPLPAVMDEAYGKADVLVFETNIDALNEPATQAKLFAAGTATEGLAAMAGPALHARVQDYARAKGIPAEVCDRFKPWYCALNLQMAALVNAGFKLELSLDLHYYARARSVQKSILWLEDPGPHLKLFIDMPDADAKQLLAGTLDDQTSSGGSPEQLAQIWKSGDMAALEKLVAGFKQESPTLYERLLAARNRMWMPRLEKMFGEDTTHLVIVGVAHMAGPDGLLNLLKARGYAVTAVPAAAAGDAPTAPASISVPDKPTPATTN